MKHPIDTLFEEAVALFDGKDTRLANAAGVSQNAIWSARRKQRVSPQLAVQIEKATSGKVPRWKWRPDLWDAPRSHGSAA